MKICLTDSSPSRPGRRKRRGLEQEVCSTSGPGAAEQRQEQDDVRKRKKNTSAYYVDM